MKRRPRDKDENNYEKFISLEPSGVLVFCVECDSWHQAVLHATAEVEKRAWMKRLRINSVNISTISMTCGVCGVSIEYLFRLLPVLRAQAIKRILGDFYETSNS